MVSIGSRRPNAKTINITFKKKHIYFGLFFFVGIMIFFYFNNTFLIHKVYCEDGQVQIIEKDTLFICGDYVGDGNIKEKIQTYKDGKYNDQSGIQRTFPVLQ